MEVGGLSFFRSTVASAKAAVPRPWITAIKRRAKRINMGDLRRLTPVSRAFGADRGVPIDRYYIENFLERSARDIHGRVLEIADDTYTRRFGGNRVARSDVLHVTDNNPHATIVADLARADHIPSNHFDCIICTQTLMFIYDVRAAVRTLLRILKPGGTLLATIAGISQICRWDSDQWGDYWRISSMAANRLFGEEFGASNVHIQAFGNVLVATGFLQGMAAEEFTRNELDHFDRDYELIVAIRAVKPATQTG